MRILTLSSLYPPYYAGGYELACADVMTRLVERGHDVHVVTTRPRVAMPARWEDEEWVHRVLGFVPLPQAQSEGLWARGRREWRDNAACRRLVRALQPDVISVWDVWGLLPSVLITLARADASVTYAVSSPWALDYAANPDRWAAFWDVRRAQGLKRFLKVAFAGPWRSLVDRTMPTGGADLDLSRAFFASHALKDQYRDAGLAAEGALVIHHGVDVSQFSPTLTAHDRASDRLLFVGRVVAEKGVHVVIEALARLAGKEKRATLVLDVVGPEPDKDYARSLRHLVDQHGLRDVVQFKGQMPHEAMPSVYRSHDILLFPSIWAEPFALTLLEAMACGLPVVGTVTGGSREILEDGITGLVCAPGDAGALADRLEQLLADPALRENLGQMARRRVERDFRIETTVDRIEAFLYQQTMAA